MFIVANILHENNQNKRAHKPRLLALIAMKECYQVFPKQCTLYLLPEHVKMYGLHVCCFVYWMEIM